MEEIYYVYEDITAESLPRVFYVGKGKKSRVTNFSKRCRNKIHTNISQKYGLTRRILLETSSEAEALAFEVEMIKLTRTCIYAEDFLFGANLTFGGEGLSGHQFSAEHRQKISDAKRGKSPTKETRKKMSESAKKRKPISCETRKKLSAISKGRPKNENWKRSVRLSRMRAVAQLDKQTGNVIAIFSSIKEASLMTGASNISGVCRKLFSNSGGFGWKYVIEDSNE